jgi:hypothetical protein
VTYTSNRYSSEPEKHYPAYIPYSDFLKQLSYKEKAKNWTCTAAIVHRLHTGTEGNAENPTLGMLASAASQAWYLAVMEPTATGAVEEGWKEDLQGIGMVCQDIRMLWLAWQAARWIMWEGLETCQQKFLVPFVSNNVAQNFGKHPPATAAERFDVLPISSS